jgi:hypothetical protein
LQVSNKTLGLRHYIVFVCWLIGTIVAAAYFISGRLQPFDPELKLSTKNSIALLEQLNEIDQLKGVDVNNTIIHFTSDDCSCTQFSHDHKQSINLQADIDGFKVINVNLPDHVASLIPSTPAILIIGQEKTLLYFGPYSIGLACTQSNGYVETVLQNYAKGYAASLIINDASGCYCHR